MKNINQTLWHKKGFTLVELMVVIAVIAILASTGTVAVYNKMPEWRLEKAARTLYSNMALTKMTALRRKADCAMIFDIVNNQYMVCTEIGPDNDWLGVPDDNTVLKTVDLDDLLDNIGFGYANATTNAHPGGGALPDGDGINNDGDVPTDEADELTDYNLSVLTFDTRGMSNRGFAYIQNDQNICFGIGTNIGGVIRIRKWRPASNNWE